MLERSLHHPSGTHQTATGHSILSCSSRYSTRHKSSKIDDVSFPLSGYGAMDTSNGPEETKELNKMGNMRVRAWNKGRRWVDNGLSTEDLNSGCLEAVAPSEEQ